MTPQPNLFSGKPTCLVLTWDQFFISSCCLISFCLTAVIKHLTVAAPIKTSHHQNRKYFVFLSRQPTPPHPTTAPPALNKLSPLQATLHSCWHVSTQTHTHTHRCGCSRHFSQSAPGSITRGRHYSHNSLASSALTRRRVLPPSIMSRKLQFPHVSYRELWSALIEYS